MSAKIDAYIREQKRCRMQSRAPKARIVAAAAIRREKLTSQQVELVNLWLNPGVPASAAFVVWPDFRENRRQTCNLRSLARLSIGHEVRPSHELKRTSEL